MCNNSRVTLPWRRSERGTERERVEDAAIKRGAIVDAGQCERQCRLRQQSSAQKIIIIILEHGVKLCMDKGGLCAQVSVVDRAPYD